MSTEATQGTIWSRIIEPEQGDLTPEAAAYILKLDFRESDHQRMAQLNGKANEGTLSASERAELEEYIRAGDLMALMQSKARQSLKRHGKGS
jgi:hypothetical protein